MSLEFATPILVAAGCGGTGRELARFGGLDGVGAFVTRTITLTARLGAPMPRFEESPAGWVHAVGLANPGLDQFLALELPWLVARGTPTVVSIAGSTSAELSELARRVGQAPGVRAVEVNLISGLGDPITARSATELMATVLDQLPTGVPAVAKVGIGSDAVELAVGAASAGSHAITVGGSARAALRDGRWAELSGPALGPIALGALAQVRAALPDTPLLAGGGVLTIDDLRLRLAAGACAVQIGAALLHDPTTAARLAVQIGEPR